MANVESLAKKRFKASDLVKPMLLTIASADSEFFGDEEKIEVGFEEVPETVLCSAAALRQLASICGSFETDEWLGEKVVLFNDKNVEFDGEKVGGLRFRAPKEGSVPKKDKKEKKVKKTEDEDVPF